MSLDEKLKIFGTSPDTSRVIMAHVKSWLFDFEKPDVSKLVPDASRHLLRAINDQNKIGWDQWFRGRNITKWGELYNFDIQSPNTLIKFPSTDRWGKEIIKITFQFVMECWYTRNTNKHAIGTDPIEKSKSKLTEEIIWLINKKKENIPEVYKGMKTEEIMSLPRENLWAMLEQFKELQTMS
jgi:hypothetical protein